MNQIISERFVEKAGDYSAHSRCCTGSGFSGVALLLVLPPTIHHGQDCVRLRTHLPCSTFRPQHSMPRPGCGMAGIQVGAGRHLLAGRSSSVVSGAGGRRRGGNQEPFPRPRPPFVAVGHLIAGSGVLDVQRSFCRAMYSRFGPLRFCGGESAWAPCISGSR